MGSLESRYLPLVTIIWFVSAFHWPQSAIPAGSCELESRLQATTLTPPPTGLESRLQAPTLACLLCTAYRDRTARVMESRHKPYQSYQDSNPDFHSWTTAEPCLVCPPASPTKMEHIFNPDFHAWGTAGSPPTAAEQHPSQVDPKNPQGSKSLRNVIVV